MIYYISLFMFVPMLLMTWQAGDIATAVPYIYKDWYWLDYNFVAHFGLSCIFGFILNYCILLCTHHNSTLTTAVVGCLKNIIIITYLVPRGTGSTMVQLLFFQHPYAYSEEYTFPWISFIGLSISIFGSLVYIKVTLLAPPEKSKLPTIKVA